MNHHRDKRIKQSHLSHQKNKIARNKFNQDGERPANRNKEVYKTIKKGTEDNTSKWKDSPCLWIGRIKNVKIST